MLIGSGLLAELPRLLAQRCAAAAYAVIADDRVVPLLATPLLERLQHAGLRCHLFSFPAGEASKTRATWASLTDAMFAAGLGRDAAVVAVGGGVTTDLGGFAAATYARGIPVVQVPTTLLAMVDAAVGGKTGVDTPEGKNLVGAFHQPRFVVCDVTTLATVAPEPYAAGIAEALKHGAIADAAYFDSLTRQVKAIAAREVAALELLVSRSIAIKADVVAADELDHDRRAILNFGHTVGHAIEAASEWRIGHGAAVAVGMVAEARLGERLGVTDSGTADRLTAAAAAFGLPTVVPASLPAATLLGPMSADKKVRAGRTRCVLLSRIGQVHQPSDGTWTVPVTEQDLSQALSEVRA